MILSADQTDWLLASGVALAWAGMTARALAPRCHRAKGPNPLLIGYASQSGRAEALARAQAAQMADLDPLVLPLDAIDLACLTTARQALFFVSTTGDGDAPDNAIRFLRRIMVGQPQLPQLSYAMLALGDRAYPQFCGFGAALDLWLQSCGATPFLPRLDLDRADLAQASDWDAAIAVTFGRCAAARTIPAPTRWQLAERVHLNRGSPGGALWSLRFAPSDPLPAWQAGDIASVTIPQPDGNGLLRDYSIASLPGSGGVELVVRAVTDTQGRPGRGSQYLTEALALGAEVTLQLRENPGFHAQDDRAPMILIGNGSGIAGLMAHLRHRAALENAGPIWLLYGERAPQHDRPFAAELARLQDSCRLTRLDRVFSRAERPEYVQDRILASPGLLRDWVRDGAVIYLCGQRDGMAEGVRLALCEVLGTAQYDLLRAGGRLRQDVY